MRRTRPRRNAENHSALREQCERLNENILSSYICSAFHLYSDILNLTETLKEFSLSFMI